MNIKASSCPQGHRSIQDPFFSFLFFKLENCGPDLRQHAIVKATNTLYPGNAEETGSTRGCVITRPCDWRMLVNKSRGKQLDPVRLHQEKKRNLSEYTVIKHLYVNAERSQ